MSVARQTMPDAPCGDQAHVKMTRPSGDIPFRSGRRGTAASGPRPAQGAWDDFGRLVVVSPHLDDGVFACGDLLRRHLGSIVITVFAGGPMRWTRPAPWDRAAGFGPGEDAIAARRHEDAAALGVLGARPVWLPFWDSQYKRGATAGEIQHALEDAVLTEAPDAVFVPLGLWHSDHRLAHLAVRTLPSRHPRLAWYAYADAIYRRYPDAGVAERLRDLRRSKLAPAPVTAPARGASRIKRRAVACYRSQLRALDTLGRPGTQDVFRPEQFWRLGPSGPRGHAR
jgi:LmbE family N-acetylglucosaminyl deacetylase